MFICFKAISLTVCAVFVVLCSHLLFPQHLSLLCIKTVELIITVCLSPLLFLLLIPNYLLYPFISGCLSQTLPPLMSSVCKERKGDQLGSSCVFRVRVQNKGLTPITRVIQLPLDMPTTVTTPTKALSNACVRGTEEVLLLYHHHACSTPPPACS